MTGESEDRQSTSRGPLSFGGPGQLQIHNGNMTTVISVGSTSATMCSWTTRILRWKAGPTKTAVTGFVNRVSMTFGLASTGRLMDRHLTRPGVNPPVGV
jgi:hypothetical protein